MRNSDTILLDATTLMEKYNYCVMFILICLLPYLFVRTFDIIVNDLKLNT